MRIGGKSDSCRQKVGVGIEDGLQITQRTSQAHGNQHSSTTNHPIHLKLSMEDDDTKILRPSKQMNLKRSDSSAFFEKLIRLLKVKSMFVF
jgi:hypothetical protein